MLVFHHEQKPEDGIHVPYSFEYVDEVERLAASELLEHDINKLAIQHDTKTLWMLTGVNPAVWIQISWSEIDREKINNIQDGAQVNQNAFSKFLVDDTELVAYNSTDTIHLESGNGIALVPDVANRKITLQVHDEIINHGAKHTSTGEDAIPDATAEFSGLMSSADKAKLNNVKNLIAGTNIILTPQGDNLVIASSGGGSSGGGSSTTLHSSLMGLSNDDHPQYLNQTRHNSATHVLGDNVPMPALRDLTDTNIVSPSNDQVLSYSNGNWINKSFSVSGGTITSHGQLLGLANDDHPHYLNNSRHSSLLHQLGGNVPHDSLRELSDTSINMPANDHVLAYSNGLWINKAMSGGGTVGALEDLSNVSIVAPLNDQTLTYSNGQWINKQIGLTGGLHADQHLPNGSDVVPSATTSSAGLMSSNDKIALEQVVTSLATHKGATSDEHSQYIHMSSDRTITARHTFSNGMRVEAPYDDQPIRIIVSDGSIANAGLGIYSYSEATNPASTRWGLYVRHHGEGPAIIALPKGKCRAGFWSRVETDALDTTECAHFINDKTTSTANLLSLSNSGQGRSIYIKAINTQAADAIGVDQYGSGNAMTLYHVGTGKGLSVTSGTNAQAAIFCEVKAGNLVSNAHALYALQRGDGSRAGHFEITSSSSNASVVAIRHAGPGALLDLNTATGKGVYITVPASNFGLRVTSGHVKIDAGSLWVGGTLTKGSGTFLIDHPLDPYNKSLSHSFVESPDMLNIYNGSVRLNEHGEATVILPAYFETLNKDFRYQLTPIMSSMPNLHISGKVSNNCFVIAGGVAGGEVEWQITGVRQDKFALANPVIVEQTKAKPGYIHEQLYQ